MREFVTLFDHIFIPQGLALYLSLERTITEFRLWVICLDKTTFDLLRNMNLSRLNLIDLSMVETKDLLSIKKARTKAEYCWTLTPFAPKFVFDHDSSVEQITYIDADMWLRKSPSFVFDEFEKSAKDVLITDHLYSPEYDFSDRNGQFCVQFIIFNRIGSEAILTWWQERCKEWCYARFEDGKFGDQKYLEEWPKIFGDRVHILSVNHPILAPWNATRFPYSSAFAVHFHGVRLASRKKMMIPINYRIPEITYRNVYLRYANDLNKALCMIEESNGMFHKQIETKDLRNKIIENLRILFWLIRDYIRKDFIEL